MSLPHVAVIYDDGAAGPGEILASARSVCAPILVCDGADPAIMAMIPTLSRRGKVVAANFTSADAVADLLQDHDVAAVTTFSEKRMELTAETAERLGLEFHSRATTVCLTDKVVQRRVLKESGVDAIRCAPINDMEDIDLAVAEVPFPAILKPRRGYGSKNVCLVHSETEVRAICADPDAPRMILEEYLLGDPGVLGEDWGDYVSVESIVLDGLVQRVFVTGKLPLATPFRERGIVVPFVVPRDLDHQLSELSARAIEACGIRSGLAHVELKMTPNGPRIIEVHGRLGGYVAPLARRSLKVDLVRAGLQVALGQRPDLPAATDAHGVAMEYFMLADVGDAHVLRVPDEKQLVSVPSVLAVDIRVKPGDRVDWRDGSRSQLGSVHLQSTNIDEALAAIDTIAALSRTTFEFRSECEESRA